MEYDGKIDEQNISFTYNMNIASNDDGDIKLKVKKVEDEFISYLIGKLDCKAVRSKDQIAKESEGRRLNLGKHRKLAIIGVNPFPDSKVGEMCAENCVIINESITAITSGDDHNLCALMEEVASFADNFKSGTVEGVTSLVIDESSVSIDGDKCNKFVIPTSIVTVKRDDDKKSPMSVFLIPAFFLAFVLFATMLFLRRRRSRIADEEEERTLRALREGQVEDDDMYAYGAGYRKYALNAVNVHKCHSVQCSSCDESRKATEFLPLENVSKWIERRGETKEEEVDLIMPDDNKMEEGENLERSRIMEEAKRVLRGDETDQVEADRRDDKLRGLPTVPEASESEDADNCSRRKVLRTDNDTGSI